MEMNFHLLRRTGYDEYFLSEVARIMEYQKGYAAYRHDLKYETRAGLLDSLLQPNVRASR